MAAPSSSVSVSTAPASARNSYIRALPFSILVLNTAPVNFVLRDPAPGTRGTPRQQRRQAITRRSAHDAALGLA
jgi:hypothetical protein